MECAKRTVCGWITPLTTSTVRVKQPATSANGPKSDPNREYVSSELSDPHRYPGSSAHPCTHRSALLPPATLRVLADAAAMGLIDLAEAFARLRSTTFRADPRLMNRLLRGSPRD